MSEPIIIDQPTANAIRWYITMVQDSQRLAPDALISDLFACGCMGPAGACKCKTNFDLIAKFMGAK